MECLPRISVSQADGIPEVAASARLCSIGHRRGGDCRLCRGDLRPPADTQGEEVSTGGGLPAGSAVLARLGLVDVERTALEFDPVHAANGLLCG